MRGPAFLMCVADPAGALRLVGILKNPVAGL
jgi:hypothetical protein